MTRRFLRCRSHVDQPFLRLAPRGVRPMFHFAHALNNGRPEFPQPRQRFPCHDRLVEHLPNHGKLHERPSPAFTGHESMRHSNQFKQAILPSRHPHFHVNPRIGACAEKLRGHSVGFAPAFLRAAPPSLHHPAVPAAAHGKSVCCQHSAKLARLLVLRVVLSRPRTPKHRDDSLFLHCINARVYRRDGRLVDYDQIPQSLPGTIHPAHPTLHGSFRLDCCSKTKKSAACHRRSPQTPNASAHPTTNPSSPESAPPSACSYSMFPASRRPPPPAATHNTAQTPAGPYPTSKAPRSPLAVPSPAPKAPSRPPAS